MTVHLAKINRHVPGNISLPPLPPYAPELNPVEQVWAYLRANCLSHRAWNSYNAIVGACCDAWNTLMSTPERLASITRRTWAKAVNGQGGWYWTGPRTAHTPSLGRHSSYQTHCCGVG